MQSNKMLLAVLALGLVGGCGDDNTTTGPLHPQDGGPDAAPINPRGAATGAACTSDAECAGGTCLGRTGGIEEGNLRFAGGYCTTLGCQANTQNGCGPDEWCIDAGFNTMCVALCSKADGLSCQRTDQVCLGLGTFGGCFSEQSVECDSATHTGCGTGEVCVRVGFDDPALGRCETTCDPMNSTCSPGHACYYIKKYNTAFCNTPGTTPPEAQCACDSCCVQGYACTPDLDGAGRHCKAYCTVTDGCTGGMCVPIEDGSPWGGCVLPGSAGT